MTAVSTNENTRNEVYFIRSLTEPETMVADVPQNISSKKNLASSGTPAQLSDPNTPRYASPVAGLLSGPSASHPPDEPNNPPSENINPNPIAKKPSAAIANTTKFFDRIIVAFFLRHRPASTSPKPAFIKNTRN